MATVRTSLHIHAEELDRALLDRLLQLQPDSCDRVWVRHVPPKTAARELTDQLLYWCRLFRHRRKEKNTLQHQGYRFTIFCQVTAARGVELSLSEEVLDELSRLRFELHLTLA